jgi:hypothetical protein
MLAIISPCCCANRTEQPANTSHNTTNANASKFLALPKYPAATAKKGRGCHRPSTKLYGNQLARTKINPTRSYRKRLIKELEEYQFADSCNSASRKYAAHSQLISKRDPVPVRSSAPICCVRRSGVIRVEFLDVATRIVWHRACSNPAGHWCCIFTSTVDA